MAASLAAKIEAEFGITSELIGGHGGLYEVSINEKVVYSNQSTCGRFPEDEDLFREIGKYQDPLSAKDRMVPENGERTMGPSRSLPTLSPCGCSPDTPGPSQTAETLCCTAPMEPPVEKKSGPLPTLHPLDSD